MNAKSFRNFSIAGIACVILMLLSIVRIDRPLTLFLSRNWLHYSERISPIIFFTEKAFGFTISKYLGFILLLAAALLYLINKNYNRAKSFLFIGATHIATCLTAALLQKLFLRSGPYQLIDAGTNIKDFFSGGNSFPCGHTAHIFGLFVPLLFLFPRQYWLLLIPLFVGGGRILINDRYVSDVFASVVLAIIFTMLFAGIFRINHYKPAIGGIFNRRQGP